jgi:Sigma-70, region 4.
VGGKRSDAALIQRLERQRLALTLRASGATYREIARQLDISISTANKYVQSALAEARAGVVETAEDALAIELERLDNMLLSIAPQLRRGNLNAIDRALKIMERRAKLLGLDKPARQEIMGADGGALEIVVRHASD